MFSNITREYVEAEFDSGRGRTLKAVRRRLERQSDDAVTTWRGNLLNLELDRSTNRLTVSVEIAGELAPEVVDYEEFKRFVLRERA